MMNGLTDRAVLVAIDEGEARHVALEFAAQQALAEGLDLRLVHVVHPLTKTFGSGRHGSGEVLEPGSAATALLEEASTLARELTGGRIGVTASVLEGIPVDVLLRVATDCERIVLQRRRLCSLDNLINGPVVAGLSARAEVPVIVVPETVSGWSGSGRRRIVVAVKQWQRDAELIERAFRAAADMAAHLQVLSVVSSPPADGHRHLADQVSTRQRQLREQVQEWRARYPEVDAEVVVRPGKAALTLLEASTDIDLMLISRPVTRLRAKALGTLSRALIREAVCAVEVVPGSARMSASAGGPEPRHRGAGAWGPTY